MSPTSSWILSIPSFINSVVAIVTVIFAFRKANDEFERWKKERQATKRAEVAGEVIVATLQLLSGLQKQSSTRVLRSMPREVGADGHELDASIQARWDLLSMDAFNAAAQLAEVFLNSDVIKLLDETRQLYMSIWAAQTIFPSSQEQETFNRGYGKDPEEKIADLKKRLLDSLRPMAQLQASK